MIALRTALIATLVTTVALSSTSTAEERPILNGLLENCLEHNDSWQTCFDDATAAGKLESNTLNPAQTCVLAGGAAHVGRRASRQISDVHGSSLALEVMERACGVGLAVLGLVEPPAI